MLFRSSLYSKIYSTVSDKFKSENDETLQGEKEVIKVLNEYNKKPIFIRDRDMMPMSI